MVAFALNHMTVPRLDMASLFKLAKALGCTGVELRNDLGQQIFDGQPPARAQKGAKAAGLAIHALAEVQAFNRDTADRTEELRSFLAQASGCGAAGVALIPALERVPVPRKTQRAMLRAALPVLQPLLEKYNLIGLIEPLGFADSSLRHKRDVIDMLAELGDPACFQLIHDSFHHHLAGGGQVFAARTGIMHISGVTDSTVTTAEMTDAHRGLVDAGDRLGTVDQLRDMIAEGFAGPVSFEAFSPAIHQHADPAKALAASIAFITQNLEAPADRVA